MTSLGSGVKILKVAFFNHDFVLKGLSSSALNLALLNT